MHWFWRAAIAVVVGTACFWLASTGGLFHLLIVDARVAVLRSLNVRAGEALYRPLSSMLWAVTEGAIPAVVTLFTFSILSHLGGRRPWADPETRCRKCGYILRGITEPRCPECGERI